MFHRVIKIKLYCEVFLFQMLINSLEQNVENCEARVMGGLTDSKDCIIRDYIKGSQQLAREELVKQGACNEIYTHRVRAKLIRSSRVP